MALRRLSLRRQNNLSERRFFEEERERRRGGHGGGGLHDGAGLADGLTPSDSIMSLGSIHLWASRPYLPDKLQIVKPLEGEGKAGSDKGKSGRRKRVCGDRRYREVEVEARKGSKRGWETEEGEEGRGDSLTGWLWPRKTNAGIERERGRRWARDKTGSKRMREARESMERPMSLMLFSFWSLMHNHKSGSFTSPRPYYKDTKPRGWL